MSENVGQNETQILSNFRQFSESYVKQFMTEKDRVFKLLGARQQYSSGIFREGLIRDFLEKILPDSISINSGFIYGFEVVDNSKQLDIMIWDSSKYGPIFKTMEYVILPPEAVIAIITVKSNMSKEDIESGLENLDSVIDLDFKFRLSRKDKKDNNLFNPIYKYFISYNSETAVKTKGKVIGAHYISLLEKNQEYANKLIKVLQEINPREISSEAENIIAALFPRMLFSIEKDDASFCTGWGPPEDIDGEEQYGEDKLKRKPYLYNQKNKITTQFDKFVTDILSIVYKYLETPGWSTSAAWADIHPTFGFRMGDSLEIDQEQGWALIDEKTTFFVEKKSTLKLPDGWV